MACPGPGINITISPYLEIWTRFLWLHWNKRSNFSAINNQNIQILNIFCFCLCALISGHRCRCPGQSNVSMDLVQIFHQAQPQNMYQEKIWEVKHRAWDKPAFISLPFPEGVFKTLLAACCPLLSPMPLYLPSSAHPPTLTFPTLGPGAAGRAAGGGDISAWLNSEHAPCWHWWSAGTFTPRNCCSDVTSAVRN